jgi:hypothetical protein
MIWKMTILVSIKLSSDEPIGSITYIHIIEIDLQSFFKEVRQMPNSFATAFSGRWKYFESSSSLTSLLPPAAEGWLLWSNWLWPLHPPSIDVFICMDGQRSAMAIFI